MFDCTSFVFYIVNGEVHVTFQTQFYMLSRLLHDYYKPVYEFLVEYDITPTLYAAPWFLTLFASHFPVGFVARVMGRFCDLYFFLISVREIEAIGASDN